jgi:prepilin-type N-terminal cleavage/methylation domain-containing protein
MPRGADGPASRLRSVEMTGFTLIEVLLALALLAGLLLSINQFVFSITEAWTKNQDRFVFVQHTRAVTRHLDAMLQAAADRSRASGTTSGAPAIAELRLPEGAGTAELLVFDLPEGDRLFTGPGASLPEVRCALGWSKDEGLVLYWKSRLEEDFATGDPRMVVVSPFVTGLSYDYYDTTNQTWTTEEELQLDATGNYELPRRLRLHFSRNGREIEEIIALPDRTQEGLRSF